MSFLKLSVLRNQGERKSKLKGKPKENRIHSYPLQGNQETNGTPGTKRFSVQWHRWQPQRIPLELPSNDSIPSPHELHQASLRQSFGNTQISSGRTSARVKPGSQFGSFKVGPSFGFSFTRTPHSKKKRRSFGLSQMGPSGPPPNHLT